MKTRLSVFQPSAILSATLPRAALAAMLLASASHALARPRPPLPPFPEFAPPQLFHESFDWAYAYGMTSTELTFANYGTLRESWSGMAL
jgi:hypothetical protein